MLSDFKLAFRQLTRSPGFVCTALLTIALGVGLNTAMFSMLNGFLLRPLSYPGHERLFVLDQISPQNPRGQHSPPNFAAIVRDSGAVAELAAYRYWSFTVSEPGKPANVPEALRVTANFFSVLGVKPELGRAFLPEEEALGRNQVMVISHRYWQSQFGGAVDIVGRSVRVDGLPTEIIGVLPASMEDDMARTISPIGIFRPLALNETERANRKDGSMSIIGRYQAGVTPAQAALHFKAVAGRLAADFPLENRDTGLDVRTLQSTTLTGVGLSMTWMLVSLSGFVLLIACANLANLLLARAIARAREFSIRTALGASRRQLVRPLVAECLLLAAAGSLAAILVARWITDWLEAHLATSGDPLDFSADIRVWFFLLGASVLTVLLFGVAPAWWITRAGVGESLKSGARGSTDSRTQHRFRQALIVTQFALALVLLAGAGFFVRGVGKLTQVDHGWNPDPVVSGVINPTAPPYTTAAGLIAFHTQLRQRLLAIPGVANASVCYEIPLFTTFAKRGYLVQGRDIPLPGKEAVAFVNGVWESYRDTMGLKLLSGRFIDGTDQLTSRPVVVINQTMARTLFPRGDAIGQRIGLAGQPDPGWAEIVGIVEDVKPMRVSPSPVTFQVYKPYVQEAWQYVTIAVRANDPALAPTLVEPIRKVIASLDPDLPVQRLMAVPERVTRNASVWQTINQLLVLFAGLGLFLAAFGIYSVIARLVSQRTNEIGIRMALGAQMRDIMGLVLGSGIRMALIGAALGLVGSYYLGQYLTKEMPVFGGSSLLPVAVAAGLLVAVALVACFLPARRATKVDPMVALRAE
jgi:putative ABC transport system permease protein